MLVKLLLIFSIISTFTRSTLATEKRKLGQSCDALKICDDTLRCDEKDKVCVKVGWLLEPCGQDHHICHYDLVCGKDNLCVKEQLANEGANELFIKNIDGTT